MNPEPEQNPFGTVLDSLDDSWGKALETDTGGLHVGEVGTVQTVQAGVAIVSGLPGVKSEELVEFPGGLLGMAFDLTPQSLGVILLDHSSDIEAGDPVRRTGRVMDIPVGDAIIGRVVDAVGRPRDNRGRLAASERLPIEREAPAVLDRAPVEVPLQTGIKVVDALVPIGRGQRELIVGDRQTGKTSIAIDAIINQAHSDVICIYCAIGQRSSSVAGVLQALRDRGAMDYTTAIVATGDDPAGLRWAAPYSAMSVGEYFMEKGRDVLVVIDDLTRHARSYREISLLLRRPPGREAYPGDIFYVHSRLLERATHLREEHGGGSLTALPIIETQAQNISAYIPTNLISITDGQVYLSPNLYQQGQLPAVDVGRSVSRVGGKAQLKAFRETSGDLRLSYSQFEELERFSRYGTRLQEQQQKQLDHGLRVRQVLRQNERDTRTVMEQVAMLFIVTEGLLDETPSDRIGDVEKAIREAVTKQMGETAESIADGQSLGHDAKEQLKKIAVDCIRDVTGKDDEQSDEEE